MVIVKWGLGLLIHIYVRAYVFCASIFVKYLFDICVSLIIVGMGRTCVYVNHVDKEAFVKGNVEPDPDELDMVFESSPSYAELLDQVRKDLN